jgi:hypothetical protein
MRSGNVYTSLDLLDERIERLMRLYKLEGKKIHLEQRKALEAQRLNLINERKEDVRLANNKDVS